MLIPIRTEQDLPRAGTAYETSRLDFKAEVDHGNRKELAKDVAAFANSVGGTIVVGARAVGERLDAYEPLPEERASEVREAYDQALRLCAPRPLVETHPIHVSDGVVLAVNVWPFPGQAVGVAVDAGSAAAADHFRFPCRSGAHTIYLKPDQLPMLMLPDVRRVAILLSSIPIEKRNSLTLLAAEGHGTDSLKTKSVLLQLDLDAVTMKNTVRFQTTGGDTMFNVPADTITHVWEDAAGKWFVSTSCRISKVDGVIRAIPAAR